MVAGTVSGSRRRRDRPRGRDDPGGDTQIGYLVGSLAGGAAIAVGGFGLLSVASGGLFLAATLPYLCLRKPCRFRGGRGAAGPMPVAASRPCTPLWLIPAAGYRCAAAASRPLLWSAEQLVEAAGEADPAGDRADREQRAGDVRRGALARVVADREALAVGGEDASVETLKLGSRSECTCVPATVAPRASRAPSTSSTGTPSAGARTRSRRSASSRAVPLGASGLPRSRSR